MPGIVYTDKIIDELKAALGYLEKNEDFEAFKKVNFLVDLLLPITCVDENGWPARLPEGNIKLSQEFEDSIERDNALKEGKVTGRTIDLASVTQDIYRLKSKFELTPSVNLGQKIKSMEETKEKLEQIICNLEQGKYQENGQYGDLILTSRTDIKKQTKTLVAEYITVDEAKKLIEKYIEQAYELGKKETKKDLEKE